MIEGSSEWVKTDVIAGEYIGESGEIMHHIAIQKPQLELSLSVITWGNTYWDNIYLMEVEIQWSDKSLLTKISETEYNFSILVTGQICLNFVNVIFIKVI